MMEIKNEDPDKIASKVNVTMKTHKEKGKVDVRLIHTSVGSPFTAFCSFVGAMIRKRLEACSDFLCGSTDDVIRIIKQTEVTENCTLTKIDIKDFYLQGDHVNISDSAFDNFERSDKRLLSDVLLHVLANQYAFSDLLSGRVFRVKTGSGIGQKSKR